MTPEIYEAEARVIYDRSHSYHESHGPAEMGRVGVAIGSEVYWAGSYCFPGTGNSDFGMMVGFATELAKRWNAGREIKPPAPARIKWASEMTDEEIVAELAIINDRIDAGFGDGGGSPGEWYYERSDELAAEQRRREAKAGHP